MHNYYKTYTAQRQVKVIEMACRVGTGEGSRKFGMDLGSNLVLLFISSKGPTSLQAFDLKGDHILEP